MEVVIYSNGQQVGQVAASRVLQWVEGLTTLILGLATGSSPLALYSELARRVKEGGIDFSCGISFALDEYMGIGLENPFSYRQTILRTVVKSLHMDPTRVRVPNGSAPDLATTAFKYDRVIAAAGGVDVQMLGISSNGHTGFNEPTSSLASRARVKTLTEQTHANNTRFFGEGGQVPARCITQGLGTTMEARHVVMVVAGRHKTRTVTAMIEGPVTAVCPALILQFHPSILVVADKAAATELSHVDYFRHIVDVLT